MPHRIPPARRAAAILVALCAAALLGGISAAGEAAVATGSAGGVVTLAAAPARPQQQSFLGFELGEERRYVLGPPEELYAGEQAIWSIRLRELLGDPPDGIFALSHHWQRGASSVELPIGTIVSFDSEGELRVNGYGFPLEVRFTTRRHLAGYGDETYTVRYRFEDDQFVKNIMMDGQELEHGVVTFSGRGKDLSVPVGMYTFVPTGLDCSIALPMNPQRLAQVAPPKRNPNAGGTPDVAVAPPRFADNSLCREQLFSNPGLISLMLPVLWEEGTGEHEYVLLTPAGPYGFPGVSGGVGLGRRVTGGTPMNIGVGGGFDHQTAVSARTNSDVETLRYVERVPVQVGPRMREAWRFEGMEALTAVYVDDDGVVLRVDLDPAGWYGFSFVGTGALFEPQKTDTREPWIRLLFPSEY